MTALAFPAAPATPARHTLSWGLNIFIWLLPFHVLAIAVLFGVMGLPAGAVRAIAAWKELLVAALLLLALLRVASGRGPRGGVAWPDLAVAGLGLVALTYLAGAQAWFASDLPAPLQLLGWRDAVFVTLLYFVGRASPGTAHDGRPLRALIVIGIVTSGIAIVERLLVTPDMLVILGAASFIQDFLGLAVTTTHNPYGLPDSYFSVIGGRLVQRAGSTYLSSQGFAIPFLLIIPAATLGLLRLEHRRVWAWLGYTVLWAGLLLTLARMTIVACVAQVILLTALCRRWSGAVGGALVAVLALIVALFAIPGFATFAWETLTWETGSSVSHLEDWSEGVAYLVEHPFGVGLGAGGLTAARFGLPPVAADSQYFKYSVELGVVGLALYAAALVGVAAAGIHVFRSAATEPARAWGALAVASTLGLAWNGLTTVPLATPVFAYVFFWLAGTTVTLANLERTP